MIRTHGRALRGERLIAKVPHGRRRTLTLIAALRHDRITAPIVLDQPINGETFKAYVEHALIPTPAPGARDGHQLGRGARDAVVLDNPGSHKDKAVREAIRKAGAHLLFLRPTDLTSTRSNRYSPS